MKKLLLITLLFIIFIPNIRAQSSAHNAKAKFIYNFTTFFEWPQSERSGDFVISVVGSRSLYRALDSYTQNRKVITQPIKVVHYKKPEELESAHMVYVDKSKTSSISEVQQRMGKNTLIIGDSPKGLQNGAALNFVLQGDRLHFEFSEENAQKTGLNYSSRLKELAAN
ncbi:MAG: YfiR family protein [Bacteroidales bacterium]